jgi:hypothetical protein
MIGYVVEVEILDAFSLILEMVFPELIYSYPLVPVTECEE